MPSGLQGDRSSFRLPSKHQSHRVSRVPFPKANHRHPRVEARLPPQGGCLNRVPSPPRQSLPHGHSFLPHRRDLVGR